MDTEDGSSFTHSSPQKNAVFPHLVILVQLNWAQCRWVWLSLTYIMNILATRESKANLTVVKNS